jgi:GDP-4-dehydro-6-deoxy-D-mannose reductase
MTRALITGLTGFAGSHLAELLLSKGYEVYGTYKWRSRTENIEHIRDKITLIDTDVKDSHNVEKTVKTVEPDEIYHLAGQSFVPSSWEAPQETLTTNIIGTVNILEAARKSENEIRIHLAGSSEEYGLVKPEETPIRETNPLRPLSPYGVSKVATDRLGFQYFYSYGLKVVITRAFNHSGPRRGDVFVDSDFAKQIALIEKKKKEPVLSVGNLAAQRDFSDVRDIVVAYNLAILKGDPGEAYNVCSEKTRTIQSMLDLLLTLTKEQVEIRQDPKRMRPSDVQILLGDCSKFKKKTGWKPVIPYEKTLKDMLDYWRERV